MGQVRASQSTASHAQESVAIEQPEVVNVCTGQVHDAEHENRRRMLRQNALGVVLSVTPRHGSAVVSQCAKRGPIQTKYPGFGHGTRSSHHG